MATPLLEDYKSLQRTLVQHMFINQDGTPEEVAEVLNLSLSDIERAKISVPMQVPHIYVERDALRLSLSEAMDSRDGLEKKLKEAMVFGETMKRQAEDEHQLAITVAKAAGAIEEKLKAMTLRKDEYFENWHKVLVDRDHLEKRCKELLETLTARDEELEEIRIRDEAEEDDPEAASVEDQIDELSSSIHDLDNQLELVKAALSPDEDTGELLNSAELLARISSLESDVKTLFQRLPEDQGE